MPQLPPVVAQVSGGCAVRLRPQTFVLKLEAHTDPAAEGDDQHKDDGKDRAMGLAFSNAGFEAAQGFDAPKTEEVRIDLPIKQLLRIRWLADFGFEHSMDPRQSLGFTDEQDAQDATRAIEQLEFRIPRQYRDPSEPHALSFNRQTMICRRRPNAGDATQDQK